jgi:hypothetical protein
MGRNGAEQTLARQEGARLFLSRCAPPLLRRLVLGLFLCPFSAPPLSRVHDADMRRAESAGVRGAGVRACVRVRACDADTRGARGRGRPGAYKHTHARARTNTQTHKRTNTHTGLEAEEAVLDYEKRAPLPVSLPPPPQARQPSRRGPSAAPRRRAETGEAGFEAAQAARVVCRVEADQAHRGAGMWQPGDREGRVTLDRVGARRAGGAAERHLNVTSPALATSLFVTS